MARKGEFEALLDELVHAPWWVSVAVAGVVYVVLGTLLPFFTGGGAIISVFSGFAGPLAAIFLIPAGLSAIRARRGRRMLAANRRKESIRRLDWEEFEELIEAHYRSEGFKVRREPGGGPDGGVDVRVSGSGETYLVQCKQWRSRRVGVKVVRELYGVVAAEGVAGGIVVTAGSFTREAMEFAKRVPMDLIDGDRLQEMLRVPPVSKADDAGSADGETVQTTQCPRCGSALVLRRARRGQIAGSTFYGCSSFPTCRFTQPL